MAWFVEKCSLHPLDVPAQRPRRVVERLLQLLPQPRLPGLLQGSHGHLLGYDAGVRTTGALIAVVAALTLAGCGHSSGSPASVAACKHAMQQEFAASAASGTKGTEPAACKGLPQKTLTRLAGEIIASHLG
jgi:hypothetical protein